MARFNSLEQQILAIWYPENNNVIHKLSYLLLKPLAIIYRLIIKLRIYCYKTKIFSSYRSNLPIIIIGNLTVGGSGKTPLVMAIVKLLKTLGLRPAIILRGYRSNNYSQNPTLVQANTSTIECGDEAKLIYNNTLCPVVTGRDRASLVKYLEANDLCNIIISDDGLQHYQLARDIEICVVDAKRKFGNEQLLPLGPLREPLSRLEHVNFVLTKAIRPLGFVNLKTRLNSDLSFLNHTEQNVHAVSAIGNNQSFTDLLTELNIKDFTITQYPDHFIYTAAELNKILEHEILLTTEKDAVKIKELEKDIINYHNIYFLKVEFVLPEAFISGFIKNIKLNKQEVIADTLC